MHRSFWPSDFRWRDAHWIACGIVGLILVIGGCRALLVGDSAWKWSLGIGAPCLALFVAWSAKTGGLERHKVAADQEFTE